MARRTVILTLLLLALALPARAAPWPGAGEPAETPAEHLWVARPFAGETPRPVSHGYLYGDTAGGRYALHTGLDISVPMGTPVRAPGHGQVAFAGKDETALLGPRLDFYGQAVVVRLDREHLGQPVFVLYGHLDRILVAQGQRVAPGDVLAYAGMTGIAIGPHLHLEVRVGRNAYAATRNPCLWLEPLPGTGALAGRLPLPGAAGGPVEPQRLLIYRTGAAAGLWRVVYTYPDALGINADDEQRENFAITDLPAGSYIVVAGRGVHTVRRNVEVIAGRLSFVDMAGK